MAVIFYNIFLWLFRVITLVASIFYPKAKKWITGRKNIFEKMDAAISGNSNIIWMHCASLGEFEQGRPILEKLRNTYPDYKYLLTFFSPSGFEATKNYNGADWIFYMPLDGPGNSKRFLEIVQPRLVIFVKYEFWFYYLKKIKYRNIPLILVSALFTPKMSFFKWYGKLQRKMLTRFDHLFVQTEESKKLIGKIGLSEITTVSGDTRFDRVVEIAVQWNPLPVIEKFIGTKPILVAGSTWPEDEEVLKSLMNQLPENSLQLIIAPHEIDEKHLSSLKNIFPEAVFYSQFENLVTTHSSHSILVIDNIGMLSRLYKYGNINYVGGGLKPTGVHNVLEAAVFGKPVLYGPFYQKYVEAIGLINCGGAKSFNKAEEAVAIIQSLSAENSVCAEMGLKAEQFVRNQTGATQKIIEWIQEKRLLTN